MSGAGTATDVPRSGYRADRLGWLDASRGIAALFVVSEHLSFDTLKPARHHVIPWFSPGLYGVMLFFLVSGYIVPPDRPRRDLARRGQLLDRPGGARRRVRGIAARLLLADLPGGGGTHAAARPPHRRRARFQVRVRHPRWRPACRAVSRSARGRRHGRWRHRFRGRRRYPRRCAPADRGVRQEARSRRRALPQGLG